MDSAAISVSFDSETNSQTMDLSTAMDNGSTMNLSVKIDELRINVIFDGCD